MLPVSPFRVEFEVASMCNLDCKYCYAQPFSNKTPPFKDIEYLLKKTKKEAGPFEVVLLGGEPFVRSDIVELLTAATDMFRSVGVSTNGTRLSKLSKEDLIQLKKISAESPMIQVSLDSINPEIHNILRGGGEATIEGINTLEEHRLNFSIGIVVTKVNIEDVTHTTQKLLSRYGHLKGLNLEGLQPTYEMGPDFYQEYKVGGVRFREMCNQVKKQISKLKREDVRLSQPIETCETLAANSTLIDDYGFKSCLAGLTRSGVLVNGDVTPCVMIRNLTLGNLYEESWKEIWKRSEDRFLSLSIDGRQCNFINLLRKDVLREKIKA